MPDKKRIAAQQRVAIPSSRGFDERLNELQHLEAGWLDGEGDAIEALAVDLALALRSVVDDAGLPVPCLFPTPEGCIQAEWFDASAGISVTLRMGGPDGLSLVWTRGEHDGDARRQPGSNPRQDITDILMKSPLIQDNA